MSGLSGTGGPTSPKTVVHTVLGPVDPDALGHCQMHEHLFVASEPAKQHNPDLWLDCPTKTLQELLVYRAAGGQALVDAQPVGGGRMATALCRVSRESGVHVVASTGFHRPLFYPSRHWLFTGSVERLRQLFVAELTEAMFEDGMTDWPRERAERNPETGTHPTAGIIKVAAGPEGLPGTDDGRMPFLAAARAAVDTDAPILIHTEGGRHGTSLVHFFCEQGVPANRVVLSHLDKRPDNGQAIRDVLALGAWVCLDTLLRPHVVSEEEEMRLIADLVQSGHVDRLTLGLDVTRARMRSYGGPMGLDDLRMRVLPALLRQGVGAEALDTMTRINPAKALSW